MRSDHLSKHLKIHKKNSSFHQQAQPKQENETENGSNLIE